MVVEIKARGRRHSLAYVVLGPVRKGAKANGLKIPQGEEWTHR